MRNLDHANSSHEKRCDDGSSSRAGVEVDQHDLLVFASEQFSVGEGDGKAGADEGAADVGVAVVVVPGALVFVVGIVGDEALEGVAEVMFDQAGLEFEGGDGGGGAYDEEVDEAGAADFGQPFLELGGDVDDVVVAFGGEL